MVVGVRLGARARVGGMGVGVRVRVVGVGVVVVVVVGGVGVVVVGVLVVGVRVVVVLNTVQTALNEKVYFHEKMDLRLKRSPSQLFAENLIKTGSMYDNFPLSGLA